MKTDYMLAFITSLLRITLKYKYIDIYCFEISVF